MYPCFTPETNSDLSNKHHHTTLTPDVTPRIPGLSEFTSQAFTLILRKRIDGCSFVSLAMKLNQTTIKIFLFKWMQSMWASMDILVYMTILCEQLCVCVYVCMHIIRSSECFEVCGSGKVLHACTHRHTH